jgi:hypothetical protein
MGARTSLADAPALPVRLASTAVACFNADDDILWLSLREEGKRTSRFASDVGQFEDGAEFPSKRGFATEVFNRGELAPGMQAAACGEHTAALQLIQFCCC